jgi:hypothetical protein
MKRGTSRACVTRLTEPKCVSAFNASKEATHAAGKAEKRYCAHTQTSKTLLLDLVRGRL